MFQMTERQYIDESFRRAIAGESMLPPFRERAMTDGQTEVQREAAREWSQGPMPPRPAPTDLLLAIRPCDPCWRWVLYDGTQIIAEGCPCGSEAGAEKDAAWFLMHVLKQSPTTRWETLRRERENDMATTTKELMTQQRKVLAIRDTLRKARTQILRALPQHTDVDRLARIVETAASRNPQLLEADPVSFAAAVIQGCQLGLDFDTTLGQAYLVPFWNRKANPPRLEVQFIPGYRGLSTLARRSGEVANIFARVVKERDEYEYQEGLDAVLRHIPARGERGDTIAVYAIARMTSGDREFRWLWREEIDKVRDAAKSQSGPWQTHYDAMAEKTAIRRLCKQLPIAVLQRAAELQERHEAGEAQLLAEDLGLDLLAADVGEPEAETPEATPEPKKRARPPKATASIEAAEPPKQAEMFPPEGSDDVGGFYRSAIGALKAALSGEALATINEGLGSHPLWEKLDQARRDEIVELANERAAMMGEAPE